MTAHDKAKGLVYKFYTRRSKDDLPLTIYWTSAIACALIAVDEIIQQLTPIENAPNNKNAFDYWEQVKKEINNLL